LRLSFTASKTATRKLPDEVGNERSAEQKIDLAVGMIVAALKRSKRLSALQQFLLLKRRQQQ
jgi:hypothetical protein